MRNLLLLLLLANILYFLWGRFVEEPSPAGIVVVNESELGPPLNVSRNEVAEAATSVGAVLGSGKPADLAAVVGRSCVTIGPIRTQEEADQTVADFESQGMRASSRNAMGQVFVGHWVQIRNIPDRQTGNAMLDKLHDGGLGEAYLVSTEDEGLKISLGLFGEKSGAERTELEAASMGLKAEVTPRMHDTMVYFVDVGLPPGKGAGAIVEKYGEQKVLLRDKATCPQPD
jgi:hypothetical protein